MHPPALRAEAQRLSAAGLSDAAVGARVGVPRRTVSDWRRGLVQTPTLCPRCWRPARHARVPEPAYALLLGLYLGDGCISAAARSFVLRISLDARYPRVIDTAVEAARACLPHNAVSRVHKDGGRCVVVQAGSRHLPCLLPQHGPGKKHDRDVSLEHWQRAIVAREPWQLLRGLLWSDGCAFVNRTGRYAYLSWQFSNRSEDIRRLFTATCDLVGVEYRAYRHEVRIYRRASAAALVEHVGVKA